MPEVAGDIFSDPQVLIINFIFLADDLCAGCVICGSGRSEGRGRHLFKCGLKLLNCHGDFLHRFT